MESLTCVGLLQKMFLSFSAEKYFPFEQQFLDGLIDGTFFFNIRTRDFGMGSKLSYYSDQSLLLTTTRPFNKVDK